MKKAILHFIFMGLIIGLITSSCSQNASFINLHQEALTNTPTITQTYTITPTLTNTPLPTDTATPTITPTALGNNGGQFLLPEYDKGTLWVNLYNADNRLQGTFFTAKVDDWMNYSEIKWSSTGKTVAILYYDNGSSLTLLRSDGSELITLKTDLNWLGGWSGDIHWSPDGQWLVFTSKGKHSYYDIYKIDLNGENLTQLTNTYEEDSSPEFLPLGDKIIYGCGTGTCMMDSDGKNIHYHDNAVDWTRDEQYYLAGNFRGTTVSYVNEKTGESKTIFTCDKDWHLSPFFFSEDNQYALVPEYRGSFEGTEKWYRIDLKTNQSELVFTSSMWDVNRSPDHKLVYFRGWLPSDDEKQDFKFYGINVNTLQVYQNPGNVSILLNGVWYPGSTPVSFNASIEQMATPVYIEPTKTPTLTTNWDFNKDGDTEGWRVGNQISNLTSKGGSLQMISTASDPYLFSPLVSIEASKYAHFIIRMKASKGETAQLYFSQIDDPDFNELKSISFKITGDNQFHIYEVDLFSSNMWNGTIGKIRLDPVDTNSTISIDYIKFED